MCVCVCVCVWHDVLLKCLINMQRLEFIKYKNNLFIYISMYIENKKDP